MPATRHPRTTLAVERLGERVLPAYTFSLSGTSATLTGGAVGETLIIDQAGGLLRHNRFTAGDPNLNSDFDWNPATAGDQTLSATNPAVFVVIAMGGGDDTLQIGSAAAPATGLAAFIELAAGGAGNDNLIVDDTANAAATTWNYTSSVTAGGFNFSNVATLENGEQYKLGSGGNTFTITGQRNTLAVTGGNGNDTVNVQVTGAGPARSFSGGGGADAVVFADGATLNGGTFDGGTGTNTLDYAAYTTPVAVNLGLGSTGLSAGLDGGQETPATGGTATATAALTNYNAVAKTFDIQLTVTGLDPAQVTGFHLHRGPVGVGGPVIIDLLPLAPLVPAGTGFTYTATGVSLATSLLGGVVNEAAFLGGQTYLNVHTTAFPNGAIRGQVFTTGDVNLAAGTATGTGGVSNVGNVTGGTAADGLIGNFGVNTLTGGAGDDTLAGGPGADVLAGGADNDLLVGGTGGDTLAGGADNDTLVWNNGDGSDVMDGEAGTDTVVVNGSLTGADGFVIGPNGTRLRLDRVTLGLFNLDIGTTETLRVTGFGGNDAMTVNDLTGVADLTAVVLNGLAGDDTFTVTGPVPAGIGVTAVGGVQDTPAPGDALAVDLTGATNPFVTVTATDPTGRSGGFAFANRGAVSFAGIETLQSPTNFLTVTKTDGQTTATAGTPVTYTVTVTNNSTLGVNGVTVTDVVPAVLTGVTWTAAFTPGSGGTASGTGGINQAVNLAAGGTVTYTVTGTLALTATGTLTNTATADVPGGLTDNTAADNTATDTTAVVAPPTPLAVGGSATGTAAVFTPNAAGQFTPPPTRTTPAGLFGSFAGDVRVATGDFNADGVADTVLVTGPGTKTVMAVVSGKDGSVLLQPTDPFGDANFTFGGFVTAGDIDRDGRAEWVVTPELRGGPRVVIFHLLADGSFDLGRGSLVANFFGIGDPSFRDGDRAALGDVNGDGILDVFSIAAFNGGPRTALYDGKDVLVAGSQGRDPVKLIGDFFAAVTGQDDGRGGRSIAVGDVNGDGVADLVVTGDNLLGTGNRVTVYSGADLIAGRLPGAGANPLADFAVGGQPGAALVSVAAKNLDGDGRADLVVGSGAGQPSLVRAYLGKTVSGTAEPAGADLDPFGGVTANGVFVG